MIPNRCEIVVKMLRNNGNSWSDPGFARNDDPNPDSSAYFLLEKAYELVNAKPALLENMREGASLDGLVSRDSDFQGVVTKVLL